VALRVIRSVLLAAAIAGASGCPRVGTSAAPPDGGAMAGRAAPAPTGLQKESKLTIGQDGPQTAEEAYWEHTKPVFHVPVGESPVLGPPDALVTIIEFSAFQGEPCASTAAKLRAVRAKYGDAIRLVWKNRPLAVQPAAEPAAEAALEVRAEKGDAAFWDVHDRFLARAEDLAVDASANVDRIVKIATDAGGSAEKLRKAVAGHVHDDAIEADLDLAEDFEVESIPVLFVNGRRLDGMQPQARLERMIDEELQRARDRVAQGTPPHDVYETTVGSGPGPWVPRSMAAPALPPGDPVLGPAKARATVHVWSDYQCALCVAVERTMADLRRDKGDAIRFVWHDLPLDRHKDARRIALAAREAYAQRGTRAFWAMHDEAFYAPQVPSRDDLDAFARQLGLDMHRWAAALDSDAHASEVDADARAAAAAGIAEAPAYLVVAGSSTQSGTVGAFVGSIEYAFRLRRVVDRALDEHEKE
jgi:protein-disulfide isomerase